MAEMIIKDALKKYSESVSILKKGYEQEKFRIEQISRSFLGTLNVRSVTSVDIATYRDKRLATINPKTQSPLSSSTVRLEMSLLSNFFEIGRIEWGICDGNPVANVRKPKSPPGRDRRLTPREDRLILRYAHNHSNIDLYSIIVIALESAMRQGEILKLRWEHINLKTRIAHLPETKNGTQRDVPLSLKARDALVRMGIKNQGAVFGYTARGLKSTWRFMLKKLDIENLHFHDLRHESVSRLFELGTLEMMEIAAISGHKSLSMLKRYTHLKATKLVRKLEGNKHKGKQAILEYLIPYPASIKVSNERTCIRLLDFEDIEVTSECQYSAVKQVQNLLLAKILMSMKDSVTIPAPNQYLEQVDDKGIVMIDPLATCA